MSPLELQQPVVEVKPPVEEEKIKIKISSKKNGDKWLCALYVTILFLVVSMPVTYKFTNALLKGVCVLASKNGCPTMCGILVHALVFLMLLRLGYEFVPMREGVESTDPMDRLAESYRAMSKDQKLEFLDKSGIRIKKKEKAEINKEE